MNVYSFSTYTLASNSYVVTSGNFAVLIDPSISYEEIASKIKKELTYKYIIITHAHFDHILNIDDWVAKTGAIVVVGKNDSSKLRDPFQNCYELFFGKKKGYFGDVLEVSEGDILTLENEQIKVLETPGHTSGSISLVTNSGAFVGDLVFADGGIGRTDLPSGNFDTLLRSIERIKTLSDDTTIYSGHGRQTTVKEIKNSL